MSGYLRLLLGGDWRYKLKHFPSIIQIRNFPRDNLFFIKRDFGSDLIQVRVPYGVLILPKDTAKSLFAIYVLDLYNKMHKIQSNDVVVDIGAHVGIFTLKAAKKARNGMVIAVEPHPLNYKILLKNIKLNKLENVIPLNMALSDYNNSGKLYLSKETDSHTITPYKIEQNSFNRFIIVKVRSLDSIVDKLHLKKINFIKVDAEGSELEVLGGAKNIFSDNGNLSIAIASYHYPKENKEVYEFLKTSGFKTVLATNHIGYLCGISKYGGYAYGNTL